ncbi:MAG: diaminopimelate epimerase [Saprospiraceae bacterium]|nr:diaminopimelate epimerase [Saprospiraceae bacterium]
MKLKFYKYHGTGNDFIMIDGMTSPVNFDILTRDKIANLCHRRFGIGADGLIILSPSKNHEFKMIYFNSDGNESTMCGNGARCLIKFASDLGHISKKCTFEAIDGLHEGIVGDLISVKMIDVLNVATFDKDFVIDTGSPHYVKFVDKLDYDGFIKDAKSIRHNDTFDKEGINVNFVKIVDDGLEMRTFERGVEDETYSCGTGVVAAALVSHYADSEIGNDISVLTKGGELNVKFDRNVEKFENIWLTGPAIKTFSGVIED